MPNRPRKKEIGSIPIFSDRCTPIVMSAPKKHGGFHKKPDIRGAVKIARELCYGDAVIARLKEAKSEADIDRILATARKEKKW